MNNVSHRLIQRVAKLSNISSTSLPLTRLKGAGTNPPIIVEFLALQENTSIPIVTQEKQDLILVN